jgi:hypothetical protein
MRVERLKILCIAKADCDAKRGNGKNQMTRIIRTERYKRGIFGWIFKILFIAFNVFMLVAFSSTIWTMSHYAPADMYSNPGAALGLTMGYGLILFVWALASFILGLLSYFTRGKKVIIEEVIEH